MVNLKAIVLFATTVSALVVTPARRDVTAVLTALQNIDKSANDLTATVTGWDGSVGGAVAISTAAQNVGKQIDDANTAASSEAQASSDDSQKIITFVSGTLEPDVAKSISALNARKADFDENGLTPVVKSTLQSLQGKTKTYGSTLVGLASADQKSAAQAAADKIDSDFAGAITNFS